MTDGKGFKSYKPQHSTEEVLLLTGKVLKSPVSHIGRIDYGEINAVYFAKLKNGEECVVRVSPRERNYNCFEQESWAFDKCRAVGAPTPEVLALDTSLKVFPEAYMITKRLPGISGNEAKRGLSKEQILDINRQLGHYYFLVHSLKIPGFGKLVKQGNEFVGKFPTLWDSISADLESGWWVEPALKHGLITPQKLRDLRNLFNRNKFLFDLLKASLVHGDLSASFKNTLIAGDKITGIVDMEGVSAADPINEFAWYYFWAGWDEQDFEALKKGYDNQQLFDANFMKKLYLYQLPLAYSLAVYYHSRYSQGGLEYVQKKIPVIGKSLIAIEEKEDFRQIK